MKIRNILSVMAAALLAAALTGCYEKYDDPDTWVRYDDQFFIDKGYTIQSVETVKKLFEDPTHVLVDHLKEDSGANDMYMGGKTPSNTGTYGRYYLIGEKYVIKGKVTSNDVYGNVYRSIFVQDDAGEGIEVKVGLNGMYSKYLIGQTVYVICEGLALGNYRSMLSLGITPAAEDHSDSNEPYANKYMELQPIVDRYVYRGAATELTSSDITVITAGQALTDAQFSALGGKLVRFEGLVSKWVDGTSGNNAGYPSFLYKKGFNSYEVYNLQDAMNKWKTFRDGGSVGESPEMPEPQNNYLSDPKPSWGFQEHEGNTHDFGSALFTKSGYSGSAEILIRTSGYARFALKPVTPDGKTVNVMAIVARYTDKNGSNPAYQLTVNDVNDIVQTN